MTFEVDEAILRGVLLSIDQQKALERVLLDAKRWQSLPENERRMLLHAQDLQDKDAHK